MGVGTAVKSLWNSETIENNEEIVVVYPLLVQAWANIEKSPLYRSVISGANSTSAQGGFVKAIDPKTEAAMRKKRDEIVAKQETKKIEKEQEENVIGDL